MVPQQKPSEESVISRKECGVLKSVMVGEMQSNKSLQTLFAPDRLLDGMTIESLNCSSTTIMLSQNNSEVELQQQMSPYDVLPSSMPRCSGGDSRHFSMSSAQQIFCEGQNTNCSVQGIVCGAYYFDYDFDIDPDKIAAWTNPENKMRNLTAQEEEEQAIFEYRLAFERSAFTISRVGGEDEDLLNRLSRCTYPPPPSQQQQQSTKQKDIVAKVE